MRPSPHAPSPHKLTSTRACGSALPAAPRDCPQPGVCCSPKPGLSGTWSVLCCSAPQTGSRTPAPATHTTRAPNTWGSPGPRPCAARTPATANHRARRAPCGAAGGERTGPMARGLRQPGPEGVRRSRLAEGGDSQTPPGPPRRARRACSCTCAQRTRTVRARASCPQLCRRARGCAALTLLRTAAARQRARCAL